MLIKLNFYLLKLIKEPLHYREYFPFSIIVIHNYLLLNFFHIFLLYFFYIFTFIIKRYFIIF